MIKVASRWILLPAAAGLIAGCAIGPNYRRPDLPAPVAFKEAAGWKMAQPNAAAATGEWWTAFSDPVLTGLEAQVATANQTLAQSYATYEAARELARADRATFFPTVGLDGDAERSKSRSGVGSVGAGGTTVVTAGGNAPTNTFTAAGTAAWTPDFWGKVRRLIEADTSAAQSSAAALANARLSLQSQLAVDYLELRVTDARHKLLLNAVESYRRTLGISQNKYRAGVSARSDVITAQSQLDATRASAIDTGIQRAQLEHAIAVLVGKAPADFSLEARDDVAVQPPSIPLRLPSELLERRPDISEAERNVQAANARVGIAEVAYFPDISLSAELGFEGSPLSKLFTAPFRFWSLGASGTETLLDFGQRRAQVQEAKADYEGTVAAYRQAVLTAFQQVEDNLAGLRLLTEEHDVQANAVAEAAQASAIAENEYRAGTVDYTTVVTAQVNELNDRETLLNLEQTQLTDSVNLIVALGGGWSDQDLPQPSTVRSHASQSAADVAAPK